MSVTTSPTMSDMCTEVNWPTLKSYLEEDKVTFDDLELPCGICHDTMTVLPHKHQEDEDGKTHNAVIFPCGHIFGKSCVEMAFGENSTLRPICFACRADLTHPRCGHTNFGKPMPSSKENIDNIPAVLSKNGCITPDCGSCLMNKTGKALRDYALEFNSKSTNQYLIVSYQESPTATPNVCYTFKSNCDPWTDGKMVECQSPNETKRVLKGFEVTQRFVAFGMSWIDKSISDYEWHFYMWTPPMPEPPKPTFHEYWEYMHLIEGERAESMTFDELRSEFDGKLPSQLEVPARSIAPTSYEFMTKVDVEDEE